MARLVALDLPGGPRFVRELSAAWEAGDAVLPVDRRLAGPARERLLDALRPAGVISAEGWQPRPGGLEVQAGDALVMATSGSTGEPKGVVLTHAAVAASARATSARLGVDPGRHRWLACLPLNHVGGLSVITRALLTGTPLQVMDGFDPAQVSVAAGPGVLVSLVATALARVDAAKFDRILLGGGPPPARLPANVVMTYGMTETGSGVVYDGTPLDGVEISLSDGLEVRVRGPMLLRAYRDGTVPLGPEGWFHTGDGGFFDDRGRLHIHGRLSDLIITGGENVWPAPIEQILRRHPSVGEVAVSSRPDPEWGERVVACVVPAPNEEPPRLEELRALVRDHWAAYAAPRELVLVPALPLTSNGKLQRDVLRRRLTPSAPGTQHGPAPG